jgi:hypothetical protein
MNIFNPESFEDVSLNMEAESTVEEHKGEKAKNFFCTYWHNGKIALQLAHDMVKNPIVKLIIKCCIFLGDGIYERVCLTNS